MKIFDAQVRSDTRSDDELRNLHYFETERIVTTAHDPHRFETAAELLAYLGELVSTEPARIRRAGLVPHVALGVLPTARPRRSHYEVWKELPQLLAHPDVVAVGEIGAWDDTRAQWELFERQAKFARDAGLPVICTPPTALPVNMTYKMLQRLDAVGLAPSACFMNRVDERVAETLLAEGYIAGIAVGLNDTEPRRAALLLNELVQRTGATTGLVLNSALRRGAADLLGIPKTIKALTTHGMPDADIERLVYGNAFDLFLASRS